MSALQDAMEKVDARARSMVGDQDATSMRVPTEELRMLFVGTAVGGGEAVEYAEDRTQETLWSIQAGAGQEDATPPAGVILGAIMRGLLTGLLVEEPTVEQAQAHADVPLDVREPRFVPGRAHERWEDFVVDIAARVEHRRDAATGLQRRRWPWLSVEEGGCGECNGMGVVENYRRCERCGNTGLERYAH